MGFPGPLKTPALKRVIESEHPDIIHLQETLGEGEEVNYRVSSLFLGWKFKTVDSFGRSGELTIGWITRPIKIINYWDFESGISITTLLANLGDRINIVNIYGPVKIEAPTGTKPSQNPS
jgi:hypothetical protein